MSLWRPCILGTNSTDSTIAPRMRPERSDWKGFDSISVIPSFLLLDYGTLPWSWFSGKDFQEENDLFGLGAPFSTDP